MAFCANCGWAMEPGASFCPRCGTPYATGATTAPGVAPMPVKLDLGELLTHASRRVVGNAGVFVSTSGIILIVSALLNLAGGIYAASRLPDFEALVAQEDFATLFATIAAYVGQLAGIGLVTAVLNAFAFGLTLVVSDAIDRGERPTLGQAWAAFQPRMGSFLGTYALIAVALLGCVLGGFVLFFLILPIFLGIGFAVFLAVCWMLAPAIAVFDPSRASENMKRSSRLTKGNRWVLFGTVFVLALAAGIPAGLLGGVVSLVDAMRADPVPLAISPVVMTIQTLVALPFMLFASFAIPAAILRAFRQLTAAPAPPLGP